MESQRLGFGFLSAALWLPLPFILGWHNFCPKNRKQNLTAGGVLQRCQSCEGRAPATSPTLRNCRGEDTVCSWNLSKQTLQGVPAPNFESFLTVL